MMWWGFGPMGGWGWFGFALSIIFWIAVIWLIVAIFRSQAGPRREEKGPPPPPRKPLEILQERYARGEIDEQTFRRMSELLLRSKKEYEEKRKDLM